jgi:esterase/lipase
MKPKMLDHLTMTTTRVKTTQANEDTLGLMDETCRSQFLLHPGLTDKVVLFFHGFTSTPEQFLSIGKVFFKAGYNVLIPRLPGHGLAGDWNSDRPPPLPQDPQLYQQFGLDWLQQAQMLGNSVIIGGLSGGSTLSAWLALECSQQIDRALLFAPYLSNSNIAVDLVVRILDIYFEWKTKPGVASFGYKGFAMPALRVFLDMGQEVLARAKQQPAAPMLIVSSERDSAVSNQDHQILFKSVLTEQPQSWYHCFDRQLDIPHNMMTIAEGNPCVDLLFAIAKAYVESNLTWAEVKAVRDRLVQGQTFEEAIAALNLEQRVSPELQTMVTILNS